MIERTRDFEQPEAYFTSGVAQAEVDWAFSHTAALCWLANDRTVGENATLFFLEYDSCFAVTADHVVKRMLEKSTEGAAIGLVGDRLLRIGDLKRRIIARDESRDVATLQFAPAEIAEAGKHCKVIDARWLIDHPISEGEYCFILGYPNDLRGADAGVRGRSTAFETLQVMTRVGDVSERLLVMNIERPKTENENEAGLRDRLRHIAPPIAHNVRLSGISGSPVLAPRGRGGIRFLVVEGVVIGGPELLRDNPQKTSMGILCVARTNCIGPRGLIGNPGEWS